ncbi:MAG: DNA mismatch repair protein MutS, partial [Firmicutes bacterium]|nr:DNA mismatch repair protein MutS [Bacillota bacterium]
MAKITPMMEQYFQIKNEYKYCLLFFRLGDFYEMFFDDAIIASKELEITLTGRDWGQSERAPMCGVPFHSADGYINRLVEKGYKVAICEQVEDPKAAKGIVKRDVVRVITPGTITDNAALDEKKNNYIMSVFADKNGYGIAVCDVTTGEFITTDFSSVNAETKVIDEIGHYMPSELVTNTALKTSKVYDTISKRFNMSFSFCDDWTFSVSSAREKIYSHLDIATLDGIGIGDKPLCISACGGLLRYLYDTQKTDLTHIAAIKYYSYSSYMLLDISTRRNLELVETMREKSRKGSLLWVLDKTKTAMGARLLKKWIEQPLMDKDLIDKRLNSVEELKDDIFMAEEIKEVLNSMYDFERIVSKIIYKTANCRDLISLKNSIENLPMLKNILSRSKSAYLKDIFNGLDTLENIFALIDVSIKDDPPFSIREGGMIKEGYHRDLDTLLLAKSEGKTWLESFENTEKEKTGIKNLRVRFNKVFGYYIEVTKSNIANVPDYYIRKQTLTNCERYTTKELDELAGVLLGA